MTLIEFMDFILQRLVEPNLEVFLLVKVGVCLLWKFKSQEYLHVGATGFGVLQALFSN